MKGNFICFELLLLTVLVLYYRNNKSTNYNFLSFEYTTILRGVAILMVYLQHTMGALGSRFFTPLGGGGVAVFLILSGYGLSESYKRKGLNSFWKKKIIHVLFPWWIIYFLFLQDWNHINGWDIFGNITLFDTTCWYLQYLFLWYIIFYVTHKYQFLHEKRYIIMSLAAFVIFFCWGNIQAEQAVTFIIGMWISENKKEDDECYAIKKSHIVLCSFIIAILTLGIKQFSFVRNLLEENVLLFHTIQLLLKTSIAITTIYGLKYCKILLYNRFLNFTGVISFELYLIHLWVVPKLMKYISIDQKYIYILLFLLFSYLISWVFYLFNNKMMSFHKT